MLSQLRSVVLAERPDLRLDRFTLQNAQRPHQLVSQITNDFRSFLKALEREERREKPSRRRRDPKLNSCFYCLPGDVRQALIGEDYGAGVERVWPWREFGDRIAQPTNDSIV